jgi:hypothetical protein
MTTITFPPVAYGKQILTSLTFRPPTLGDMEESERITGEIAKTVFLVARLSGVPIAHIRQIPATHFAAIVDRLGIIEENARGNR